MNRVAIRFAFCALLVITCAAAIGCGAGTKELKPDASKVEPNQEEIRQKSEDAKARMMQMRQGGQPGTGS